MKASAIIRICVWSMVALILCAILIIGLTFHGIDFNPFSIRWGNYTFDDANTYSVGGTTLNDGTIHSIDVEWLAGSVRISATKEDEIIIRETVTSDSRDALRWRVRDGELQIRYCKPRFFGRNEPQKKNLEILLPSSMLPENGGLQRIKIENVSSLIDIGNLGVTDLEIENVSGDIDIGNDVIGSMDLETVSGGVNISLTRIGDLELSTVSGNINMEGEVRYIDLSGVSARLFVNSSTCPDKLSVETVSGTVHLSIPADSGFHLSMDSISGSFHAPDFSVSARGDGEYICGDGYADFDIESVSGSINIQKNS